MSEFDDGATRIFEYSNDATWNNRIPTNTKILQRLNFFKHSILSIPLRFFTNDTFITI